RIDIGIDFHYTMQHYSQSPRPQAGAFLALTPIPCTMRKRGGASMQMTRLDRPDSVQKLLTGLHGLDSLKKLFWTELNYTRANTQLPYQTWSADGDHTLVDDPTLLAVGRPDH